MLRAETLLQKVVLQLRVPVVNGCDERIRFVVAGAEYGRFRVVVRACFLVVLRDPPMSFDTLRCFAGFWADKLEGGQDMRGAGGSRRRGGRKQRLEPAPRRRRAIRIRENIGLVGAAKRLAASRTLRSARHVSAIAPYGLHHSLEALRYASRYTPRLHPNLALNARPKCVMSENPHAIASSSSVRLVSAGSSSARRLACSRYS